MEESNFILMKFEDPLADMGDIDNDGLEEIIYTRMLGIIITGKDRKEILSKFLTIPKISKKKKKEEREKRRQAVDLSETDASDIPLFVKTADVNGDGKKEIIIARADGVLFATDQKGEEIWGVDIKAAARKILILEPKNRTAGVIVITEKGDTLAIEAKKRGIKVREFAKNIIVENGVIGDVNGDGEDEIVLISRHGDLLIYNRDFSCMERISTGMYLEGAKIVVGEIDNDGLEEVVIADRLGRISVWNWGEEIKIISSVQGEVTSLYAMDINSDRIDEIIVLTYEGFVYILKGSEIIYERREEREIVTDLDNDGKPERLIRSGRELIIQRANKRIIKSFNDWISSICASDINHDGVKEIIVTTLDRRIMAINIEGRIIWTINVFSPPMRCIIDDFDQDGKKELIILGDKSIYVFKEGLRNA